MKEQERIFDIHHPYVTCKLGANSMPGKMDFNAWLLAWSKSNKTDPYRIIWSFARLLLEIQGGRYTEIDLDGTADGVCDGIWKELRNLELSGQDSNLRIYLQAVHGCVSFAKSLEKYEHKAVKVPSVSFQSNARRIFYAEVVQCLEVYHKVLSRDMNDIASCDISLSSLSTEQKDYSAVAQDSSNVSPSLSKCSFSSQPTSAADLSKSVPNPQ
jgi:hypothetical protein